MSARIALRLLVSAALVVALLPLAWTLLASLRVQPDNTRLPPVWSGPPSLDAYLAVREEQTFFWEQFGISLSLAAGTVVLAVSTGFFAAYSLSRSILRRRRLWVQMLLLLAIIPPVAYAAPMRELLWRIGLLDTFLGLLLAESALYAPLAAYILVGYLGDLPYDYDDSARLDGAGLGVILRRVIAPLLAPGLVAAAVIVFALSWNQYVLPLLLTDTRVRVLPVLMRDLITLERDFEWDNAAVVIILSLIPAAGVVAASHQLLERLRFGLDE